MACNIQRLFGRRLRLQPKGLISVQIRNYPTSTSLDKRWTRSRRIFYTTLGILTGAAGAVAYILDKSVKASDLMLRSAHYPWYHNAGIFNSLDHASIRRGYDVFKQVCAGCHSLRFIAYRDLVDVTHTEQEAKAEAEEVMITDGPDDTGSMFERPGKLSDYIPCPYPNEEAARFANNGAFPPDLSYIIPGRRGGEDYLFSLLLGYMDPPAGVTLMEGQNYNPYFVGGAISMAQTVFDEVIEYQDGTPATASQIAKDVTTFLKWTAEPEFDDRKLMLLRVLMIFSFLGASMFYLYRFRWAVMKTRSIQFNPKKHD